MPMTDVKARIEGLFPRIDALRCFSIRSMVAAPEDDTNRDLLRDILLGRTSNFINTDYLF
jgi:glyceraldehyde-3-phosphate dehydrogenase (NADP+)